LHSITESGYASGDLSPGKSATERRVWPRWVASVEMVGREKERQAANMWAARSIVKKEKPARETREEIYLFGRAGSCPRKSGRVSAKVEENK
jgi:hypothetical protein